MLRSVGVENRELDMTSQLNNNNNKKVKNLYSENCKTLKKKIEEDTNKWKDVLCSCVGIINMVKMSKIVKQSTYSINFYQNSNDIFHRNGKKIKQLYKS